MLAATAALTISLPLASPAFADQANFAVGAGMSTYGYGIEAAAPLAAFADVRANTGTFSYGLSGEQSGFNYNGTLKLNNVAALVDFHPFVGNGFRVSTGVVTGSDRIDLTGKTNGASTVTINGNTYAVTQVGNVNGTATFGGTNPYLGFGFGSARGRRGSVGFVADFGVMFEPAAVVNLTTSMNNLPPQGQAQLMTDLAQAKVQMQNALSIVRTYPVVKFGFQTHI